MILDHIILKDPVCRILGLQYAADWTPLSPTGLITIAHKMLWQSEMYWYSEQSGGWIIEVLQDNDLNQESHTSFIHSVGKKNKKEPFDEELQATGCTPLTSQWANSSFTFINIIRFSIMTEFNTDILPNRNFCFLLWHQLLHNCLLHSALLHAKS